MYEKEHKDKINAEIAFKRILNIMYKGQNQRKRIKNTKYFILTKNLEFKLWINHIIQQEIAILYKWGFYT